MARRGLVGEQVSGSVNIRRQGLTRGQIRDVMMEQSRSRRPARPHRGQFGSSRCLQNEASALHGQSMEGVVHFSLRRAADYMSVRCVAARRVVLMEIRWCSLRSNADKISTVESRDRTAPH